MAVFSNFDFGKGLKKQAEAFARLPSAQRPKRHEALVKQLEAYANKYLYTVLTQSAQVNPGQLRTGAEALVDIAKLIDDPAPAYRTFTELAARSRKVAAVPQLGQLVDRLLEQKTDQKKERAALLTYRIVTGTLGSERYLGYLRERAHLTDEMSDWKEYAVGVGRLIRDGVVQANDEVIAETLQDLVNNKQSLGDQAVAIQQMLAESMLQRRNHRQAELILVDAAVAGKELPESFNETVETLLNARPECCWELHQLVLDRALKSYADGELDWPALLQRLARAKQHLEPLARYLVEHPLLAVNERIASYTLQTINNLPHEQAVPLRERWHSLVDKTGMHVAGATPPPVEQAEKFTETVPPPPSLGGEPAPSVPSAAILGVAEDEVVDAHQLRGMLEENVPLAEIDLVAARSILRQLSSSALPEWAPFEARLWLIEELARRGKERIALGLLEDLLTQPSAREAAMMRDRLGEDEFEQFARRLAQYAKGDYAGELQLRLVRLSLQRGFYSCALDVLRRLPADSPLRQQGFSELERAITRQANPAPAQLMTLAEGRRLVSDEPEAGLDTATTAALLAPHDPQIQSSYRRLTHALPPLTVGVRRASQALYLVTREDNLELLPTVMAEIQALATLPDAPLDEALQWMGQLRAVLEKLPAESQPARRREFLHLYLRLAAQRGSAQDAMPEVQQTLVGLSREDQIKALYSLQAAVPQAAVPLGEYAERLRNEAEAERRQQVESELQTARSNGRPLRYAAGEASPPDPDANAVDLEAIRRTEPWRRSLAVARRKRETGDTVGAIRELQAALEIEPLEAELSIELAECFTDDGSYNLARRIYVDTLERLESAHGKVELRLRGLYGLATVIEHIESPAAAMHHLEQLLIIRHDYRDSRERLARLKESINGGEEAEPLTPSAVAANLILDEILSLLEGEPQDAKVPEGSL
jgi:hypothetical protein